MGRHVDLTGLRFGRLVVVCLSHTKERGRKVWRCLCDCGNTTTGSTDTLNAGTKQSCGCLHAERIKTLNRSHGKSGTRTHRIWTGMRARCEIPSATGYAQYGGRGISVCREWRSYEVFLSDMGECPDGMSIERIDVNLGYCRNNCRWAPLSSQPRNTTRSRWVVVDGEKRLARDVALENGITIAAFKKRLYKLNWPLERACGAAK